ncbi:MAG: PAS domain S-box protein, partial [Deltaproteobacteria bacterium]|nr:PAS domain S-box protein [Deltaproteobacteria bacterium]
ARDEGINRTPSFLKSDRHRPEFYNNLQLTLKEAGSWRGEIWNRRKSGEVFPMWESISSVKDEKGRTIHYVAIFSDITSVKRAEERLQYLAHYDPLTALPNRLLFRDRL